MHYHRHSPETWKHGDHQFYRCADPACQEPLYEISGCGMCFHPDESHDETGCWVSVREAAGIARCECLA